MMAPNSRPDEYQRRTKTHLLQSCFRNACIQEYLPLLGVLQDIPCAICGEHEYRIRYDACIDYGNLVFAARRAPSRNHCRIVQCKRCGLVYANPIFKQDAILQLYTDSIYTMERQVLLMSMDYFDELAAAGASISGRNGLLEIGCANGDFLGRVNRLGYTNIRGIEPIGDAVRQAAPSIKDKILIGTFQDNSFPADEFDVVCINQVIDHLFDPNAVLSGTRRMLRKGGHLFLTCHNVRFPLTIFLGERSPMFDIEHIYLFDKSTIRMLLEKNGFEVVYVRGMRSRYTLGHIIKMFPFPRFIKRTLDFTVRALNIEDFSVKFWGGNMVALAKKRWEPVAAQ